MTETAPGPTSAVSTELPFGATRQEGRYEVRRVLGRGAVSVMEQYRVQG